MFSKISLSHHTAPKQAKGKQSFVPRSNGTPNLLRHRRAAIGLALAPWLIAWSTTAMMISKRSNNDSLDYTTWFIYFVIHLIQDKENNNAKMSTEKDWYCVYMCQCAAAYNNDLFDLPWWSHSRCFRFSHPIASQAFFCTNFHSFHQKPWTWASSI